MNATPKLLTAATVAALVLTLSACGGGDKGGDKGGDGGADEPRLGAIDKLFEDVYADVNEEDSNAQQVEIEELTATCMAEQGFDYTPVDYSLMTNGGSADFEEPEEEWGTVEFAEKWGYGATTNPWGGGAEPMPVDGGDQWVDPNQEYVEGMSETESQAFYAALYGEQPEMTEEEMEEYVWSWEDSGCSGWAQHEIYGDSIDAGNGEGEFADLEEEMNRMWESSSTDPRMAEIEAEWAACMSDAGYPNLAKVGDAETVIYDQSNAIYEDAYADMDPNATEEDYKAIEAGIQDALAAITAEEIETATADFGCREESNYTETQQDINIEYQQEFYDAHKDELEAYAESMADRTGG